MHRTNRPIAYDDCHCLSSHSELRHGYKVFHTEQCYIRFTYSTTWPSRWMDRVSICDGMYILIAAQRPLSLVSNKTNVMNVKRKILLQNIWAELRNWTKTMKRKRIRKENIYFFYILYDANELVPLSHSFYGYILFSSIFDTCTLMWRRKWKIDFFWPYTGPYKICTE